MALDCAGTQAFQVEERIAMVTVDRVSCLEISAAELCSDRFCIIVCCNKEECERYSSLIGRKRTPFYSRQLCRNIY